MSPNDFITEKVDSSHESAAHFVQFYETDDYLLKSLSQFVKTSVGTGDICVVVATNDHHRELLDLFRETGFDHNPYIQNKTLIFLDAELLLSQFMTGEELDSEKFRASVGDYLAAVARNGREVRVFGEMVAVLSLNGQVDMALKLENSWNELQKLFPFTLYCAYPMTLFERPEFVQVLENICSTHSSLIPAESFLRLSESERNLEIVRLQQKACSLEKEIADRKAAEAEREEYFNREQAARLEAENANRMKDEFLATISHELRTPLTPMLGWIRILHQGNLSPSMCARAVEAIERSVQAQTKLIDDLLDVSRIVSGKLRLELNFADMKEIIRSAVETIRPAAEAKDIHVQVSLQEKVDSIYGDGSRLQQVMWNLLSNAVKFTPEHGAIWVVMNQLNSQFEISVGDTGSGIHPDFLPHVFDQFRQQDGSVRRRVGGMGLGLAIVRHLVEMHGGTVKAESPGEGNGSVFRISLPQYAVTTAKIIRSHTKLVAQKKDLDIDISLKGIRVLVVEDEPETREMLKTLLSSCKAEVRTVPSVEEALTQMQSWTPHVLLSDIGMPGATGYDLIRKVRSAAREELGKIPAIALTAYAKNEDRLRALSEGFNSHVTKPIEPAELIHLIYTLSQCVDHDQKFVN